MNKTNSIFIIIILLIAGCSSELPEESQRTINQGEMIGIESDNNTFAWLGIPFAEPPVGNLRWKAPLQPKPFNSRFEANQSADICFQTGGLFRGLSLFKCLDTGLVDRRVKRKESSCHGLDTRRRKHNWFSGHLQSQQHSI